MQNVLLEREGFLAIVTVNRPQKLNALDAQTIGELTQCFRELSADDKVGAIILTGAGEKAFIAGADISVLAKQGVLDGTENAKLGQQLTCVMEESGKPILAAINGFALGGGLEMALACDLRFASDNAKLGQPEVNLGIIPGYGGTQRLPRLGGQGLALELCITGRAITAEEAYRIGLVNRVVPQADLIKTAEDTLKLIMGKGPLAVKACIEAVYKGMDMDLDNALNLEAQLFGVVSSTADMKEGLTAFLEKRPAQFKGE